MYPAVATAPMAVPDAKPGVRPPAPRAMGKATANPAPTQANPMTAAGTVPISSAPVIPRPATKPPTRTSCSAPKRMLRESPVKRIPAIAATGYAASALAMAGMRFAGDAMTVRFGAERLVRVGSLVACLGMAGALLIGTIPAALIGFACVGGGLAVTFPIALGAGGRTPGLASGTAIGAVATAGYTGLLVGAPLIGFVSHQAGLRVGLALVAVLCFVTALLAGAVRPQR